MLTRYEKVKKNFTALMPFKLISQAFLLSSKVLFAFFGLRLETNLIVTLGSLHILSVGPADNSPIDFEYMALKYFHNYIVYWFFNDSYNKIGMEDWVNSSMTQSPKIKILYSKSLTQTLNLIITFTDTFISGRSGSSYYLIFSKIKK